MRLTYDIVDVFTDRPFAGNQLAVVHGADELSTEQCQALAREFGFSESTFPALGGRPTGAEYATRIFTPEQEIPFAGHPTLGTAWVLRSRGRLTADEVTQVCGAGPDRGALRRASEVELTADAARPGGAGAARRGPRRCCGCSGLSLSDLAGRVVGGRLRAELRARPGDRGGRGAGGPRPAAPSRRWPSGSPAWAASRTCWTR